uniref:Uncharacterized protein n=1 Tax=Rhizophora mucronata TaxID=61149 RepID=A0A2P2QWE0_RHIMU
MQETLIVPNYVEKMMLQFWGSVVWTY